jgi:hypothetical protein
LVVADQPPTETLNAGYQWNMPNPILEFHPLVALVVLLAAKKTTLSI